MSKLPPIPSGPCVQSERDENKRASVPALPASWTATVLLSPYGHSSSALKNRSQLVVGTIEYSWAPTESSMRTRLYLTQDQICFDFFFFSQNPQAENCQWYWIDSTPKGIVNNVYGPLPTRLRIPAPTFFSDLTQADNSDALRWGNRYPLMCTDTNRKGIDCDHWIGGRSWYAFRRDTGHLFRILTMESSNPQGLPILGSYYLANIPTFCPGAASYETHELIQRIRQGDVVPGPSSLMNEMLTQQDIHRAMYDPLASASCTPQDIQAVLPGFIPMPAGVPLPRWTDRVYIESWTLDHDAVPYRTRVCYLWTEDTSRKMQTVLIGRPIAGGPDPTRPTCNAYLERVDACLSATGSGIGVYKWTCDNWQFQRGDPGPPSHGVVHPDWVERSGGMVMGQIVGNSDFGLACGETLNLIAGNPHPDNIFWVWFLQNGVGMMFSRAIFGPESLGHIQLADYNLFVQHAPVTQDDFSGPFPAAEAATEPRAYAAPAAEAATELRANAAHGHIMSILLDPKPGV
jgi:hypothetical protein